MSNGDDDIARRDRETRERDTLRQLETELEDHNPDSLWYTPPALPEAYTAPAPTGLPDAPTVTARCKACGARWRAGLQQCQVCQSAEWWIED